MKRTAIQWTHSTINPVMGCDGCELWRPATVISDRIRKFVVRYWGGDAGSIKARVMSAVGGRDTSKLYRDRKQIADQIIPDTSFVGRLARDGIEDVIRRECKCYAGLLGTLRAGHKGYADAFGQPQVFPGRIAKAASWGFPTVLEIADKPWLANLPRLIFISDMGDALCSSVSFDVLKTEIIDVVGSDSGKRHLWLWLTKRPGRMAEFGTWLLSTGVSWPHNLVAMTTVTRQANAGRVDQLRRVPAKLKGLSMEPLFERVKLDLDGIDWVIVGGGSDTLAEPFLVEWALELQTQCRATGAAFFLKQLGRRPFRHGIPLPLVDKHGGDWSKWPEEWRIREFPALFQTLTGRFSNGGPSEASRFAL